MFLFVGSGFTNNSIFVKPEDSMRTTFIAVYGMKVYSKVCKVAEKKRTVNKINKFLLTVALFISLYE